MAPSGICQLQAGNPGPRLCGTKHLPEPHCTNWAQLGSTLLDPKYPPMLEEMSYSSDSVSIESDSRLVHSLPLKKNQDGLLLSLGPAPTPAHCVFMAFMVITKGVEVKGTEQSLFLGICVLRQLCTGVSGMHNCSPPPPAACFQLQRGVFP